MEHNIGGYYDHKTRKMYDSHQRLVGVIEKKATNEEIDALYQKYLIQDQTFESLDEILNHLPQATNNKVVPMPQNDLSSQPISETPELFQVSAEMRVRKAKSPVRQSSNTNVNFLDNNQELESVPDQDQTKL